MPHKISTFYVSLLTSLLLLGSCSIGPKQLKDGHLAYNEAVRISSDKELLLNIVRVRYMDTIEFLSTNSISAQVAFSVAVGARGGQEFGDTTSIGLGEISWSNRPTFTFTPQRGAEFAQKILTPIPLPILVDLAAEDLDILVLTRLMISNINGVANITGNENKEFAELTRLMARLQAESDLFFGSVPFQNSLSDPIAANQISGTDLIEAAKAGYRFIQTSGGKEFQLVETLSQPVLYVPPDAQGREKLRSLLGVDTEKTPYFELHSGAQPEDIKALNNRLYLDTRSVLESISYLATGVQVPTAHVDDRWVFKNWPIPGATAHSLPDLFEVRTSPDKPSAALAVPYKNHWFYIADNDVHSRLTFSMLAEILRLALSPSGGTQQAPVLTLPVGG